MDEQREKTLERLGTILDSSIPLGKSGYRIGLDPIVGLIPGVGDAIGALLSTYIIWGAARLGVSRWILARMLLNVAVETFVGVIPIVGDVFDFAFKANQRNIQLLKSAPRIVAAGDGDQRLASTMLMLLGCFAVLLGLTIYLAAWSIIAIVASFS